MRANKDFSYIVKQVPPIPTIFNFIKEHSGSSDEDMYGNFNMGAGFAIYLPTEQVEKAKAVAEKHNLKSWNAGIVQTGSKKVVIKSKNITFQAESLGIR